MSRLIYIVFLCVSVDIYRVFIMCPGSCFYDVYQLIYIVFLLCVPVDIYRVDYGQDLALLS